jgi:predicted aldo/keto reductase-like oxidoreductase
MTTQALRKTMNSTGDELSILGFGCLRLPKIKKGVVDEALSEALFVKAIESGINYFDSAYLYNNNEELIGRILERTNLRDKVNIATKLPSQSVKKFEDIGEMFEEELIRLKTDRIEYYLIHNVSSSEEWFRVKSLGVDKFIETEKRRGRIKNIGFSFHGNLVSFKKMVDDYDWDFCQIQYNYIDEYYQAGTAGLQYAHEKGLGVVVMEPLRGGKLVNQLPPEATDIFNTYPDKRSPAEWGLRWVLNHPEVNIVLSGMNSEAQVEENVRIASTAAPNSLKEEDLQMLERVKTEIRAKTPVNCTACGYCLPCPYGVDIPSCFSYFNNWSMYGGNHIIELYTMALDGFEAQPSKAGVCKQCGACEKKCPQNLPIRKHLKECAKEMEKPLLRYHFRFMRYLTYKYKKVDIG